MIDTIGTLGMVAAAVGFCGMVFGFISEAAFDYVGHFVAALIFGILAMFPAIVQADNARRDAFMGSCLKDRKDYECTAMWRAGERHTSVVPMPVIIGGHR